MTDAVQLHCTRPWYMRPPVWVLGVVLVALALFGIIEMIGRPAALPYSEFLDQLDAGNVASVIFQGTEIDGRFKHPLNAAASNSANSGRRFRSRVPDFGDPTLIPELRKQQVVIDVVSSSSWTRLLGGLPLPMLLMLWRNCHCRHRQALAGRKGTIGTGYAHASHARNGGTRFGPFRETRSARKPA